MLSSDSSRCNNTAAWGAGTTKRSPLSLLTSFLHLSLSIRVDKQEARTADVSFLHFSHAQTQIQKPWVTKETTSCLDAERFWRNRHHHIQKTKSRGYGLSLSPRGNNKSLTRPPAEKPLHSSPSSPPSSLCNQTPVTLSVVQHLRVKAPEYDPIIGYRCLVKALGGDCNRSPRGLTTSHTSRVYLCSIPPKHLDLDKKTKEIGRW